MRIMKRSLIGCITLVIIFIAFTIYANIVVEKHSAPHIYPMTDNSIPYNRVSLLLGTNPLARNGRPNTYFTSRISAACELFNNHKTDFIIVSGDNHSKAYDEPSAMRDSLIAHGIPADRIYLDYAGFRTLDSVVRAKQIFGCDTLTIISQRDHAARALYLAKANSINAVAFAAPLKAGRKTRMRLTIREWLARDKMLFDLWTEKKPHFLGDKIVIPKI